MIRSVEIFPWQESKLDSKSTAGTHLNGGQVMAGPAPKRVLQRLTTSEQNQTHHSPKPKLIKDRVLKPENLRSIRPRCSWSQRQKIRVLVFLYHHRIPIDLTIQVRVQAGPGDLNDRYRAPTHQEAAEIYGVPQRTISDWVRKQGEIEKYSS